MHPSAMILDLPQLPFDERRIQKVSRWGITLLSTEKKQRGTLVREETLVREANGFVYYSPINIIEV